VTPEGWQRPSYKTVAGRGQAELEEKRSRFIGRAARVESEEEAAAFLAAVRAGDKLASHHVYAYVIGGAVTRKRYSDDGEPQGTGGVPVLDVLEKRGLEDAAVAVTRYFGGTLLGAAGLARAYGKAASMAVEAAGEARRTLASEVAVLVAYAHEGAVQREIARAGYAVRDAQYGADVELRVQVPAEACDAFIARLAELTAGQAVAERAGVSYIESPLDG